MTSGITDLGAKRLQQIADAQAREELEADNQGTDFSTDFSTIDDILKNYRAIMDPKDRSLRFVRRGKQ